jgi:hypothetical protein
MDVMKRIVNGVTYNTDTSTALAKAIWGSLNDEGESEGTLYQTRGGAFFAVTEVTEQFWNEREGERQTRIRTDCEPLSREDAQKWLMEGAVEIFSNPFDDPPEAAAEDDPGATIYMRVPVSLKKRAEDAANKAGVSSNVWAMRCLEHCASATPTRKEIEAVAEAIFQTHRSAHGTPLSAIDVQEQDHYRIMADAALSAARRAQNEVQGATWRR